MLQCVQNVSVEDSDPNPMEEGPIPREPVDSDDLKTLR